LNHSSSFSHLALSPSVSALSKGEGRSTGDCDYSFVLACIRFISFSSPPIISSLPNVLSFQSAQTDSQQSCIARHDRAECRRSSDRDGLASCAGRAMPKHRVSIGTIRHRVLRRAMQQITERAGLHQFEDQPHAPFGGSHFSTDPLGSTSEVSQVLQESHLSFHVGS
jgi:hypothetical protein